MLTRAIVVSDQVAQSIIRAKRALRTRSGNLPPKPPGVQPVATIEYRFESDDVRVIGLRSLSHSLWRSIELNVVGRMAKTFHRPILDLGCGDGLFAREAIGRVEFGLDVDESPSLREHLQRSGTYERVDIIRPGDPFPYVAASLSTVVSNSVLEHVPNVDSLLNEVSRVLRPGGRFIFTVPTSRFAECLSEQFDRVDSAWFNQQQLSHHNLWTTADWAQRLKSCGFEVSEVNEYFSDRACYWYRVFANQWITRLERVCGRIVIAALRRHLHRLVMESVNAKAGACAMFVAVKGNGCGSE